MTQLLQRFERKHMVWLVNALVFLFFVTVLTFKKGYSYAPMTLAGIGIIYLFIHIFKFKKPLNFTKEDKWLIFAFLFYFGTFAFSAVYHGDGWREIDNPSRVLLFIPLLLLFREFPINIKVILHGISIGAAVAGIIAIYQKFYLGQERAYSEFMAIQGGDIAMSLGLFSLIICGYLFANKQLNKLLPVYFIFSLLGFIGSGLSGSRGAWISMPVIILIMLFLFRSHLQRKMMIKILLSMIIISLTLFFIPQTNIKNRIIESKSELTNYILHKKDTDTAVGGRFELWNTALIGIKEKPILGWGNKEYLKLKEKLVKQKVVDWFTLRFNDAHNQYLDSTVKRGAVGLLGLFSIIFIPLFYFIRICNDGNRLRILPTLGLIHIISSTLYFLTQSFLNHNSGSIFYFFIIIMIYSMCNISNKK